MKPFHDLHSRKKALASAKHYHSIFDSKYRGYLLLHAHTKPLTTNLLFLLINLSGDISRHENSEYEISLFLQDFLM